MTTLGALPWAEESEFVVLGSALVGGVDVFADVVEAVSGDDFYSRGSRSVFGAMERLMARGAPIDPPMVLQELHAHGENAGGYIGELMDAVAPGANVRYHASLVREMAVRRKL
jgi:replicative DNA helicase